VRRVNPPSASTDEGTVKDEESARVAIEEKKKDSNSHLRPKDSPCGEATRAEIISSDAAMMGAVGLLARKRRRTR